MEGIKKIYRFCFGGLLLLGISILSSCKDDPADVYLEQAIDYSRYKIESTEDGDLIPERGEIVTMKVYFKDKFSGDVSLRYKVFTTSYPMVYLATNKSTYFTSTNLSDLSFDSYTSDDERVATIKVDVPSSGISSSAVIPLYFSVYLLNYSNSDGTLSTYQNEWNYTVNLYLGKKAEDVDKNDD